MFYQEREISSLLICPGCDCKYEDPRMLACGKIICKFCVEKLEKKFICSFCSKNHFIPDEGLPECETVSKLLSIQSNEVHRSDHVKSLKAHLNDIEKKISELTFSINNGVDFIKEYCIDLRNDVQCATEKVVKEINEFSEQMINKINKYEKERIKDYQELKDHKEEFTKFVDEMKKFHTEWSSYLKHFEIKDQEVLDANTRANELKNKSKEEKTKLDHFNFNGQYLKYHKNLSSIDKRILGSFSPNSNGPLSFESLIKFSIRGILTDYRSDLKIEMLSKDAFIVSYHNSSGYSSLKILNKNMIQYTYNHKMPNGYTNYCSQISFAYEKNKIAASLYCPSGYHYLKTINSNLTEIKKIQTPSNYSYQILGSNDFNIFCLTKSLNANRLNIYDWNLLLIKQIGQSTNLNSPFYFPNDIIQFSSNNGKYYWLNANSFNILDELNGDIIKTIPINATKFHFNSNKKITLFCNVNMEIVELDQNGEKQGEAKLYNFPANCSAFFEDDGQVHFFDNTNLDVICQN